jgi:low temperature requirement protein LtrA
MNQERLAWSPSPTREGARVTTLELFFDLAFVFAFTQLSRLMAERHDLIGIVEAMTILALLWWCWNSYGWLSNLARADRGWISAVMLAGMGLMVVVGVTVLEAYDDLAGGLLAPFVFVGAYLAARCIHAVAFVTVSDVRLRRRAIGTLALSVGPAGVLLLAGAALGGLWQLVLWLVAAGLEPVITHRMGSGVDWRVGSAAHFTERHGLIVILAIGESIIAIGAGAAEEPTSLTILLGIAGSLVIAAALWWAYFRRLAEDAERGLIRRAGGDRARTARDAYTYLHLLIVAGIVITALGIEQALVHVDSTRPAGWFTAAALGGGTACFLVATVLFDYRVTRRVGWVRAVGSGVLLVSIPLLAILNPLVSLFMSAALLLSCCAAGGHPAPSASARSARAAGTRRPG